MKLRFYKVGVYFCAMLWSIWSYGQTHQPGSPGDMPGQDNPTKLYTTPRDSISNNAKSKHGLGQGTFIDNVDSAKGSSTTKRKKGNPVK